MRSSALTATLLFALPLAAQNPAGTATTHRTPAIVSRPAAASHVPHTATRRVVRKPVAPAPKPAPKVVAAAPTAAPFEQNPINQLRGNARALLVFAPDSSTPALRQQMLFLDRHELDLTSRNTVLVPIVTQHHAPDAVYGGENLPSGTYRDQLSARQKFGIKYNEFAVVLLDSDGNELFRSATPLTAEALADRIDGGETVSSFTSNGR